MLVHAMDPDFAAIAIVSVLAIALDLAALRWGVDSRFSDVRSDF